ncbi:MAG: molybdopterin molybdotransferase MoeA [Collinsella intestinalis]
MGIISLGTELVDAGAVPARGQIRDVNGPALMASAREAGAEPVFYGIAPDDEERICELVRRAASECDVVVTSGGASAGDYDYVTALIEREGEVLFDRVSIKPGKAVTFGLLGETPFFGLSGNPAGAFVGFELFVRPALRKMMGHTELARPVQEARATHGIKKRPGRAAQPCARGASRCRWRAQVMQAPRKTPPCSWTCIGATACSCSTRMPVALTREAVAVLRYDVPGHGPVVRLPRAPRAGSVLRKGRRLPVSHVPNDALDGDVGAEGGFHGYQVRDRDLL